MYSEEQKQQIYKRFIERGRPWFALDKSLEPTYAERQVILEMNKREQARAKRDIKPKRTPKNEVRAFDRLINQAADY